MTHEDLKSREQMDVEAMVTRALERRPEIAVPEDFAARVARSLPAKEPKGAEARPVFGRAAGYLATAAMMVVLVALALMHPEALSAGRGFLFAVEMLVVAQLLAVVFWLGMKSDGLE
jgi:hypothetical protein